MNSVLVADFARAAAAGPGFDLAGPALVFARLEYPTLAAHHYLAELDRMGAEAKRRLDAAPAAWVAHSARERIRILNDYLFGELGFSGNRDHYDDPRNSFLNEVLDRRTGIPISLAVVYVEVARRAGVTVEGVNFPGHFLLRAPVTGVEAAGPDLLIDAFNNGALLSAAECRQLLEPHLEEHDVLPYFATATKTEILVRMLLNLKRVYVHMRSFPQARAATDLLLAIDPSALTELRDRGLLAYHLNDFPSALRDLETYLRNAPTPQEEESQSDHQQVWEHIKTLRRRVAELN